MRRGPFRFQGTYRMRATLMILMLTGLMATAAQADDPVIIRLAAHFRVTAADVAPSPVPGLYQLKYGPQIVYVTADGKYILRGDIIDSSSGANLSANARAKSRIAYINDIGEQNMVVFGLPKPRHTLTVLTDIDCQYCRALNQDTPALNAAGVEVRYLAFPRAGVDSSSWEKAVAVWCAKDRKTAYQEAMAGATLTADPKCDQSAVAAGYHLAHLLGLDGTPIIITEQGQIISGYIPAPDLLKLLDDPALQTQQGS